MISSSLAIKNLKVHYKKLSSTNYEIYARINWYHILKKCLV